MSWAAMWACCPYPVGWHHRLWEDRDRCRPPFISWGLNPGIHQKPSEAFKKLQK